MDQIAKRVQIWLLNFNWQSKHRLSKHLYFLDLASPYTERAAVPIEKRTDMFREYLQEDIGRPVKLDVDIIAADMKRYSSHHSEPQTGEKQTVGE